MYNKGMSLIELLVIVTVLSLLATIGFPCIQRARDNANETKNIAELKTLSDAVTTFYHNEGRYPENWYDLHGYLNTAYYKKYYEFE